MGAPAADTEATRAVDVGGGLQVWVGGFAGILGAGLREVIARDDELQVVDPEGLLEPHTAMARYSPRAVLLKDAALSSAMELRRLVVTYPATGVVVGVVRLSHERDQAWLAAGARMVVPLTIDEHELRAVLRLVACGLVGPPRVSRPSPDDGLSLLTARETEVFELLARRRTAREVADALHIAIPTVHTHTRRIYEKLGVHSRAELEAWSAAQPGGEDQPAPLLSRDRVPYGRRSARQRNVGRPSALDMRAAMGVARWPR